jgi:hypothetical protein
VVGDVDHGLDSGLKPAGGRRLRDFVAEEGRSALVPESLQPPQVAAEVIQVRPQLRTVNRCSPRRSTRGGTDDTPPMWCGRSGCLAVHARRVHHKHAMICVIRVHPRHLWICDGCDGSATIGVICGCSDAMGPASTSTAGWSSLLQKSRIGLCSVELQLGVDGDDACQNAHLEMGLQGVSNLSALVVDFYKRLWKPAPRWSLVALDAEISGCAPCAP